MELDQLDLNSRSIYTDEVLNELLLSKNQNDFQTILANHVNKSSPLQNTPFSNGSYCKISKTSYITSILNCLFSMRKVLQHITDVYNRTNPALFDKHPKYKLFNNLAQIVIANYAGKNKNEVESKVDQFVQTIQIMAQDNTFKFQSNNNYDPLEFFNYCINYLDTCNLETAILSDSQSISPKVHVDNLLNKLMQTFNYPIRIRTICIENHPKTDSKGINVFNLEPRHKIFQETSGNLSTPPNIFFSMWDYFAFEHFLAKEGNNKCDLCAGKFVPSVRYKKIGANHGNSLILRINIFNDGIVRDRLPKIKIYPIMLLTNFFVNGVKARFDTNRFWFLKSIVFFNGENMKDGHFSSLTKSNRLIKAYDDFEYCYQDKKTVTKMAGSDIENWLNGFKYDQNNKNNDFYLNTFPYILFYELESVKNNEDIYRIRYQNYISAVQNILENMISVIPRFYRSEEEALKFLKDLVHRNRPGVSSIRVTKSPGLISGFKQSDLKKTSSKHEQDVNQGINKGLKRVSHSEYELANFLIDEKKQQREVKKELFPENKDTKGQDLPESNVGDIAAEEPKHILTTENKGIKRQEHSDYNLAFKDMKESKQSKSFKTPEKSKVTKQKSSKTITRIVDHRSFSMFTSGIRNRGNECYLNSMLQAFFSLEALLTKFSIFDHFWTLIVSANPEEVEISPVDEYSYFIQILTNNQIMHELARNNQSYLDLQRGITSSLNNFKACFYNNQEMTGQKWLSGTQQDTQEAIVKYIEYIDKYFNTCLIWNFENMQLTDNLSSGLFENALTNLFKYRFKVEFECKTCHACITHSRADDFSFGIEVHPHEYTCKNVLESIQGQIHTQPPDYRCERCNNTGNVLCQKQYYESPPILMMHCKIFEHWTVS